MREVTIKNETKRIKFQNKRHSKQMFEKKHLHDLNSSLLINSRMQFWKISSAAAIYLWF